MKICRLFLPQLLLAILTVSCFNDIDINTRHCIDGIGGNVIETRTMPSFHSIENTIAADIILTQGPQEDVTIEAQGNILDELRTKVVNGALNISFDECVNNTNKIIIHITIPDIKGIVLTGTGDIVGQNFFELTDLSVIITGAGNMSLQGTSDTFHIKITGVGDVNAFALITNYCAINISGVGDSEVYVNDELNVIITGTGTVYYKGQPIINSTITGAGKIENTN